jgi:hypothetical protein
MVAKINENTELQVPLRNLISMVIFASVATWGYFGVLERINQLEHAAEMTRHEQKLNSEFRIRWPRGELGSLPADAEQFMKLRHLEDELTKLTNTLERGDAPFDRQQKLTLEFFERRVANMESELQKLKDATLQLKANGYNNK